MSVYPFRRSARRAGESRVSERDMGTARRARNGAVAMGCGWSVVLGKLSEFIVRAAGKVAIEIKWGNQCRDAVP